MAKFIELHRKLPQGQQNINQDKSIEVFVDFGLGIEMYFADGATIVHKIGKPFDVYMESPSEIIAKINENDIDVDECFECEAHPDAELKQAVRELLDASYLVNVLSDTTLGGEVFIMKREKLEKLLGEL